MFLCCYVVKLGKAKKAKEAQPKSGSTSGYFAHGQLCLHVQKLLFFGQFSFFALLFPKHYKNSFYDFDKLIVSLFGSTLKGQ